MRTARWLFLLCSVPLWAQPALHGTGASSYYCADHDGDGYGTGPVALGPYTDLAIDATDNMVVTSASHSFVSADIGRVITITTGSGFNLNWYLIKSVSAGAATLLQPDGYSAAVGTVGSTAGSWRIYGCLGPDADDLDATVHTYAQASAKYGTMQKFLTRLGYSPTRIWLLDSTGNPTASSCTPATFESGCVAAPRSVAPTSGAMAAGDMVMVRANYNGVINAVSGTSSTPVIVMAYPGETPFLITGNASVPALTSCGASTCLSTNGLSWVIVDGIQENGSIGLGDNNYAQDPHPFHDNVFRHIYGGPAGYQGLGPEAGGDRITVEDSVFANNNYGGSQAGLYLGCTYITPCTNFIVRRNIAFNNAWDGIHWNGVGSGHTFTQNISHSNGVSGFAFQSGLTNSTISANLSFNNVSYPMQFYQYKDNDTSCTTASPAGSQPCGSGGTTGNVVQNNTLVTFNTGSFPPATGGGANGCFSVANHTPTNAFTSGPIFDMGHNTFRNNICVNWGDASSVRRFAPFNFSDPNTTFAAAGTAAFATTVFDHNLTQQVGGVNGGSAVFGVGDWGQGSQINETTYTCTTAGSLFSTGSASNCIAADPKFAAAQQSYWYDTSQYDLRIYDTSPAFHAGTSTGVPDFDLRGRLYIGSPGPSIGAIERQLFANGFTDLGVGTSLKYQNTNNPGAVCATDGAIGAWFDQTITSDVSSGSQTFVMSPVPPAVAVGTSLYVTNPNEIVTITAVAGGNVTATFTNAHANPWHVKSVSVNSSNVLYPYTTVCGTIYTTWGSAIARKGELYVFNGGHSDSGSNQIIKLNLNTTAPALSKVTDPSVITVNDWTRNPVTPGLPDGAAPDYTEPIARHTWGAEVYLPDQDSMWIFAGSEYPGPPSCFDTWTFGFGSGTWTWKDPSSPSGASLYSATCNNHATALTGSYNPHNVAFVSGFNPSGASVYDPTHHLVYTLMASYLFAYDPVANTTTTGFFDSGGGSWPHATLDSNRGTLMQIGYISGASGHVITHDVSGGLAGFVNTHSSVFAMDASCAGWGDTDAPGQEYDPISDRVVGWAQNGGGKLYFMDPVTRVCTSQTFTGGPPTDNDAGGRGSSTGTYGKFRYLPSLDVYALIPGYISATSQPMNAYVLNLNASDPSDTVAPATSTPVRGGTSVVGSQILK